MSISAGNGSPTSIFFLFDFTFKDPAPPVGIELECSYPGHYEKGVHIDITVI
jgi:hypothetical protein